MAWRFVYRAALAIFAPMALIRLIAKRAKIQGEKIPLANYLAFYPKSPPLAESPIWVHAVSVGESAAAAGIIEHFLGGGESVLLTHTTASGYQWARKKFGGRIRFAAYPLDSESAARRFLAHFHPRIGVFMETEIWPNMLRLARKKGIPLILANARLSAKSARKYARIYPLAAEAIHQFDIVVAQTAKDARRFNFFGARRIAAAGNLKFDIAHSPEDIALGKKLRKRIDEINSSPVLLFASTRAGEEKMLLDEISDSFLHNHFIILVPRHPERCDEVADLIRRRSIAFIRKSELEKIEKDSPMRILLGDTLGEMQIYCEAADAVFVGGGLASNGGQNPIEAMTLGKAAAVGPKADNFADIVNRSVAAGAMVQCDSAAEIISEMAALAADSDRRKKMGIAAKTLCEKNRGALAKTLSLMHELIS